MAFQYSCYVPFRISRHLPSAIGLPPTRLSNAVAGPVRISRVDHTAARISAGWKRPVASCLRRRYGYDENTVHTTELSAMFAALKSRTQEFGTCSLAIKVLRSSRYGKLQTLHQSGHPEGHAFYWKRVFVELCDIWQVPGMAATTCHDGT